MLQVFNHIFRQPAKQTSIDLHDGILPYGRDNSFPLRLATLVQESPTGSSGISVFSDFIEGAGFSDPTLKDIVINGRGETFGMLHSVTADSFALFRGFSWLIKYNELGEITEIYSLPFENVRLGKPSTQGVISKIHYNPYYGTPQYERKDTVIYDSYTPDKIDTISQIRRDKKDFKGQILYFGTTRPLSRFYPEPDYYSCQNWLAVDAGISKYHKNNLDTNFFQSFLLKKIGNPTAESPHPDDWYTDTDGNRQSKRTVGQRFELDMQPFLGAESQIKMIVDWAENKEQLPEISAFPQLANDNFFTNLQETCDRKILTAMKIPGILVNQGRDNSLSDGSQMANATRVMQDRAAKPQNALENIYKKVLSRFYNPFNGEIKILNTNSFQELDEIDPQVWEVLTVEEKRKWVKENTEYPVFDTPPTVQPTAPQAKFQDIFFTDYPEKAKKKAKEALTFMENSSGCGTKTGRQISSDIVDGRPLSFKTIRRIYSFLQKNRINENKLFSDSCEAVLFSAWGGSDMLDYCASKIKMINE